MFSAFSSTIILATVAWLYNSPISFQVSLFFRLTSSAITLLFLIFVLFIAKSLSID
jgi:hypothetical protein